MVMPILQLAANETVATLVQSSSTMLSDASVVIEKRLKAQDLPSSPAHPPVVPLPPSSNNNPVSATPPEILIEVFSYAVLSQEHEARNPTAVAISHVCHIWREIALDVPVLWTAISTLNPRRNLTIAKRSKVKPIDIRAILHTEPPARTPHLVLKEEDMARVRVLALCPYALPLHLACQPMLALEELELHGTRPHNDTCDGELMMFLNRGLFKGVFPRLRVLRLDFIALHPSSPLLRAPLTVLCLCDVPDVWETSREMIECLRGLPALQDLSIIRCSPELYEYTAEPVSVQLPCLRSLKLEEPAFKLVMALPCLRPHPRCTIALHATEVLERDIDGLRDSLQALFSPTPSVVQDSKDTRVYGILTVEETLTSSATDQWYTTIFSATASSSSHQDTELFTRFFLSLELDDEVDRIQFYDGFFERGVLPSAMRNVSTLVVDLSLLARHQLWMSHLYYLRNVKVLRVRGAPASGLPFSLREKIFDAFPRLEAMHIEHDGRQTRKLVESKPSSLNPPRSNGPSPGTMHAPALWAMRREKEQVLSPEDWVEHDLAGGLRGLKLSSEA